MSWIYPRTINITRPAVPTELGAGAQPQYSGELPSLETTIATGVQAAIQMKTKGGKPSGGLPGDAASKTFWLVLTPLPALANGKVQTRDIVTDDLGNRYAILSNYFTGFGGNFIAEKLEL